MREVEVFRFEFCNELKTRELRLDEKLSSRKTEVHRLDRAADNSEVAAGDSGGVEGSEETTVDLIADWRDSEIIEGILLEELHLEEKGMLLSRLKFQFLLTQSPNCLLPFNL